MFDDHTVPDLPQRNEEYKHIVVRMSYSERRMKKVNDHLKDGWQVWDIQTIGTPEDYAVIYVLYRMNE